MDDLNTKWTQILNSIDKERIPIQFVKKMILKLQGKKQHTINIEKLIEQGLEVEHLEEIVTKKIHDLDEDIVSVQFELNIEMISEIIQPRTDILLKNL